MQIRVSYLLGAALLLMANLPLSAQTIYTLQKALQTAKATNPVLKTQSFDVHIAESDITSAKLRPNLNLSNQTLQQVDKYAPNTSWASGYNRQTLWQLAKPIQWPNQRKYKIDVANQRFAVSQKNYAEEERNLFLEVGAKWLDVWTAQRQLELLKVANSNVDSLVAINRLRQEKQVITTTELYRTQLLSNQYRLQIINAQQTFDNELKNLKLLLGVADSVAIDTTDTFTTIFGGNADQLLQQALSNRTDLQLANAAMTASASNVQYQKSLAAPQPLVGVIYNPQNKVQYVGFTAAIDLPFWNRNQGEIRKSQYVQQQSAQNLQAIQLQINTEVQTAYNSFVTQQHNLDNFTQVLAQSENILSSVRYAYLKGGTTIVDYLEAQRSWLETRQGYYDTVDAYRKAYIQLLYATGLINQLAQ
ncbi:outer membrane protein, cobalt-zinc-cadmium efflux system [Chitinophaga costaii]|uniref:Outer membrane protein, cobalt-zinc-cadmium efflux system n=1 Tax=Chitinophaga costaii TaxID=1335309 RepID=A0A1C4CQF1_9BACT|nr:TolC family protein [Chitinophaga costaii]PUZ26997.1 TolC family protein [Chitinophaga costaii]SCC21312.1 outer membrane protein, cobalt-zinc-cadmium efflux system [Chitinophaga costaii]